MVRVAVHPVVASLTAEVIVAVLQSSVAATVVKSAPGMMAGAQFKLMSLGFLVKVGAVVTKVQVMCWTHEAVFPQASVATYVIVRVCEQPVAESELEQVIVGVLQVSVAATELISQLGMVVGLQPRSRSGAQVVNVGLVVSTVHVMFCTQDAVLPQASVAM